MLKNAKKNAEKMLLKNAKKLKFDAKNGLKKTADWRILFQMKRAFF
jgi:hypothetical protein